MIPQLSQVCTAAAIVAAVAGAACRAAPAPPADLIVTNAQVYTVNTRQPRAEAVAIRGGSIAAVGSRPRSARYAATPPR